MSDPFADRPFPRGALIGAAALIAFAMVAAGTARLTGLGRTESPTAQAIEIRDLNFVDRADGTVTVHAAGDERIAYVLRPGDLGFVRVVLRGLARERLQHEHGPAAPFRLTRWDDGRLTVEDPTTGRRIDLRAFGADNAAAFEPLLAAVGVAR